MNILNDKVFSLIHDTKIIPVIKIDDDKKAVPTVEALCKGGIQIAEITYRTDAASKALCNISASCPNVLAGAGTITNMTQAKEAVSCGAKFIVMPAFYEDVIDFCQSRNVPVIPGVAT